MRSEECTVTWAAHNAADLRRSSCSQNFISRGRKVAPVRRRPPHMVCLFRTQWNQQQPRQGCAGGGAVDMLPHPPHDANWPEVFTYDAIESRLQRILMRATLHLCAADRQVRISELWLRHGPCCCCSVFESKLTVCRHPVEVPLLPYHAPSGGWAVRPQVCRNALSVRNPRGPEVWRTRRSNEPVIHFGGRTTGR